MGENIDDCKFGDDTGGTGVLERDLQDYIARNVDAVFGFPMTLIGREVDVGVGRVDILATDAEKTIWVIELKIRACSRDVVGQVLSYLGAVRKRYPSHAVVGAIVGPRFDDTALAALSATTDMTFFKYEVRYAISELSHSPRSTRSSTPPQSVSRGRWAIDVSKGLLIRRGSESGPSMTTVENVTMIPGVGVNTESGLIPFAEIELLGDGYQVGQFRKNMVNIEPKTGTRKSSRMGRRTK
jgi:hypothetical protein